MTTPAIPVEVSRTDVGRPAKNTPLPSAVAALLDQQQGDRVLMVDDVPDNLSLLHDALDEHGYVVLAATSGEAALACVQQGRPDIVLLDAMMPGMDGFEVARRLKADPSTAHIPIIFMTGLTETEHLVAALQAGGVDYVTKPLDPRAVLARMQVHLQGARQARQTRQALDAFGYASIAVRASSGRLLWQTPLAREAEVLYWVVKGKINRDIGEILGASPATVKKHLERIHAKLGVETRTAAASMALTRVREMHPQWEV